MLKVRTVKDAYEALDHPIVKGWFSKIEQFRTPRCEFLLLVPCAKSKPYSEKITKSLFYRWLWKFLKKYNLRDKIFVVTVSEPLAVIPENMYDVMPNYDFPPSILKKDKNLFNIYIKIIGTKIYKFLIKNYNNHYKILAYVKPFSTHYEFIKFAQKFVKIRMIISEKDIKELQKNHPKTWQLNWMVWLEDKLLKEIYDN